MRIEIGENFAVDDGQYGWRVGVRSYEKKLVENRVIISHLLSLPLRHVTLAGTLQKERNKLLKV